MEAPEHVYRNRLLFIASAALEAIKCWDRGERSLSIKMLDHLGKMATAVAEAERDREPENNVVKLPSKLWSA